jgi:hypothetical protein
VYVTRLREVATVNPYTLFYVYTVELRQTRAANEMVLPIMS